MRVYVLLFLIFFSVKAKAQDELVEFMSAGIEDAQTFAQGYFSPATDAVINNMSNNWYTSGEVKSLFQFEITIAGNMSFTSDESRSFTMNTSDYNNISFASGAQSLQVASALGANETDISVLVDGTNGLVNFELPQGLSSENIDFMPGAYAQFSMGLPYHFEAKIRFLPEIKTSDVEASLYGFGIQHEFTEWVPFMKHLPVGISGFIGYTRLKGTYNLTKVSPIFIDYDDQLIDADINSWHYAAIVSTKLPIINFYGSIGYVSGKATTAMKGTYEFNEGIQDIQDLGRFKDPFSVKSNVNSFKALVGARLKLGFVRLNAAYSVQDFNTLSVGLSFGN
ncbi:hypothetical protein CAP47_04920 [Psychroflexus sp. S27]|uniref:DUF6588 family protein n=1 Tax=Psychroflexus sp. S27 TaxID=1982757 RepID=UPI000C2A0E25|nr:DUF6588 family protein [Psychroflexus sp. S27]PJX24029.1 hypothetical protein CAP47_04920 [Psychroflexus sp. S27]